jgi:carbamoyl-phosphate synthase large subunit
MKNGEIAMVINSVEERRSAIVDSRLIRTTALSQRLTYYTTIAGAHAAVQGMRYLQGLEVYPLQSLHAQLRADR